MRLFHRLALPRSVTSSPRKPGGTAINPLRLFLFGRPIPTERQEHAKLPKIVALPVFASDAISSVAYASQQIILVLAVAGLWTTEHGGLYSRLTLGVTFSIIVLLGIVVTSYWQVVHAFPGGGGSYIVSRTSLGMVPGLIAGAALLIDYVLTVAVSIAAGVQNLLATPLLQRHSDHTVTVCVLFIAALTLANLRGLKESGTVFAFPTYLFVGMATMMIILGVLGPRIGWEVNVLAVNREMPEFARRPPVDLTGVGMFLLIMKAFANGCAAMTGTEAISDTVPTFRKPEARNAGITLVWMALILAFLFAGISWLSASMHVVYWETGTQRAMPVIDQLSGAVFGKTGSPLRVALYYTMQFSTTIILVLAANTSFAGFPTLASIMSRDRLLPRQLANRGDKLVYSNGIVLLGFFAATLVVVFRGSVEGLIPLYAVGVFTAFTLSQSGMVRRWLKERGPRWRVKCTINLVGAIATGIVLAIIAIEKGPEGAWIVLVVGAALCWTFRGIWRHYERCRRDLSLVNWNPTEPPLTNTVLLLVPSLHRGVFSALKYAQSLSPDCRGIHVEDNPEDTPRLLRDWEEHVGDDIPLVILPSPFRSLIGPLLAYLNEVRKERTNHVVTVVVPEFSPGKWWHAALHNANGFLVKYYLGHLPGVIVSNVRFFLGEDSGNGAPGEPGATSAQVDET